MTIEKHFLINIDDLNIPEKSVNIYVTDLNHRIIFMNETCRLLFQELFHGNLIGITINELFSNNSEAIIAIEGENQKVLNTKKTQLYFNNMNTGHGNHINFLTMKIPIYSTTTQLAGVLGMSYYIEQRSVLPAYSMGLSKREIDSLFLLLDGMTYKEIASHLNLSNRTVESYIENIRNKLSCDNKQELLNKINKTEIIKDLKITDFTSVNLTYNNLPLPFKK